MDLNYDYHEFQRDTMNRLAQIYAESLEDENNLEECDKTFNKIQKILDCQEMEKCHPYLYTLDREHVNECDKAKVDKLYECGVKRGFINEDDDKEEDDTLKTECDDCDSTLCGGPDSDLTGQQFEQQPLPPSEPQPTFHVLYSAMNNGDVKMGEFYSQATSNEGARKDCIDQLRAAGYSNITIMAIEQNADAVNQDVDEVPPGENLYNMYEDDSEEYEKQETGDTSDDTSDDTNNDTSSSDDDSSSEDNSEDNSDTDSDSDGDDEETSDDTQDGEGDSEEEKPEEDSSKEQTDDSTSEDSEESTDDTEDDSSKEEKKDDSKKKDSSDSEDSDEEEEEKKLTAEEKATLKDEYTKIFKQVLPKVSTEKSVSEMTIAEKTDFYSKLSEKWTKDDPTLFLKDKDQEKLNKFIAKPEEKESK